MNKRLEIREIVDSMLNYFDAEGFDELDSLLLMDLIVELEDHLDINIPLSVLDDCPSQGEFINRVIGVWEDE